MSSYFASDLFSQKYVVVSGGTSGIGLAIALEFSSLGAEVIVLGTDEGKAERLRQTAQGKELSVELLDLRDSAAVKAFCGMQSDVHVLINCAGIARPNEEWDEPTFLDVLDVNLAGYMRLTYGLINSLINSKGCIINIASMLSFLGDAYVPAYSAAKSGILGFTRSLAHKLGPHGVRVNAIAPGYILTDMTSSLILDVRGEAAISRRTALGRVGATQDLVGAATFLCSPGAEYITGVCLPVDGGYLSGNPLL